MALFHWNVPVSHASEPKHNMRALELGPCNEVGLSLVLLITPMLVWPPNHLCVFCCLTVIQPSYQDKMVAGHHRWVQIHAGYSLWAITFAQILSGHVHITWLSPEFYFRICHACVPALLNVTELNIFEEILAQSPAVFVATKQLFLPGSRDICLWWQNRVFNKTLGHPKLCLWQPKQVF